jgi:hypothetical protein
LSNAPLAKLPGDDIARNFQIDQPHPGLWRLVSSMRRPAPVKQIHSQPAILS